MLDLETNMAFPRLEPPDVFKTRSGVPYLKEPVCIMIAAPRVDIDNVHDFIVGFDPELNYHSYLKDIDIPDPETLVKFAGQLCYMSLGPKRTYNSEVGKYLDHIKESGHGSVLEHANWSFLCYGVSRSLTHELVRHRAGMAFSQVSQRYVSGKALRFVERPEFQNDVLLHDLFEKRIDLAACEYNTIASRLMERQTENDPVLKADNDRMTDLRKKVNQAARACLPNETEAPIVVTLNARSLRHVLEMRGSEGAETEIRRLAYLMYKLVFQVAPYLFSDYEVKNLSDGTFALNTKYRKV